MSYSKSISQASVLQRAFSARGLISRAIVFSPWLKGGYFDRTIMLNRLSVDHGSVRTQKGLRSLLNRYLLCGICISFTDTHMYRIVEGLILKLKNALIHSTNLILK